ncbi:hypothetical protein [Streptomyces sp. V1I1]|uniref:hypothetical protein n=1 Tax=Streptomyces sp. V1I1 TaxID=3042272 RepID=UPI002780C4CC|nr:hypothetical protein [Streptomyces sp. V1I1]MDQ0938536.1 hypothetical protein [Streptomyces sp. V1I1]
MYLQTIADELYGLYPADFIAARNEHAAAARKAGDRKLAGDIQSLRRPTLSAWASNQLVRRQPDQVRPRISRTRSDRGSDGDDRLHEASGGR